MWPLNSALLLTAVVACWQVEAEPTIPPIWHSQMISEQSYHLLADLQLPHLGKSYLVEEWASVPHRAFRFDSLDETETGRRRSILSLNETGEIFQFEPFKCQLVQSSKLTSALPLEVSDQFVSRNSKSAYSYVVTGVGSLWLYAMEHPKPKFIPALEQPTTKRRYSVKSALRLYDSYFFEPTEEFPYALRLYFGQPDDRRSLFALAVFLFDKDISKPRPLLMRIRIERLDFPLGLYQDGQTNSMEWSHDQVFSIPVGYGCQRRQDYRDHEAMRMNPLISPPDALGSDSKYTNRMMRMEAVVSQPASNKEELENWFTRSISMQVLYGDIEVGENKRQRYMVLESAQYALAKNGNKSPYLDRQRQVWVLGAEDESKNAETLHDNPVQMYLIDERSGECLKQQETYLWKSAVDINEDPKIAKQVTDTNPAHLTGLNINWEFIQLLFGRRDAFQLLQRDEDDGKNLTHLVYELRLTDAELLDMGLSRLYDNHISIVRRHTIPKSAKAKKLKLDDIESSATIYLFDTNKKRQTAQVNLRLLELEPISTSELHDAIDVSSCYEYIGAPERIGFILEFDLAFESTTDKEDQLFLDIGVFRTRTVQSRVKRRFLMALNDAPVQVDLQQVVGLEVNPSSLEDRKVQISGYLLDRPLELDFGRWSMMRMKREKYKNLLNQITVSALDCAHSCTHFNCRAFDYCNDGNICTILVENENLVDPPGVLLEFNTTCGHFQRRARKPYADAHQFAHELQNSIRMNGDEGWLKPLRIYVRYYNDQKGKWLRSIVKLHPSSIRFETDRFHSSLVCSEPQDEDIENKIADKLKRVPYTVVVSSARFQVSTRLPDDKFPFRLQSNLSLEQCESLCNEVHCGSFAYCSLDKSCMLSLLHKTHEIEQYLDREQPFCTLLARNYETKFHRLQTPVGKDDPKINSLLERLEARNERDCANACIESEKKCHTFYFCRRHDSKMADAMSDCYLSPFRLADYSPNVSPSKPSDSYSCLVYSRSYLVEFTRHYNKQVPASYVYEVILMTNEASAELCASHCAQADRCTGFMVCLTKEGPSCMVASSNTTLQVHELEPSDNCSSFVLAPDAQLNRSPKLELLEELDTNPAAVRPFTTNKTDFKTSWYQSLFLLFVGWASGYSVAFLVVKGR